MTLTEIIDTPMADLRFRDFAKLRVGGRDSYSRQPLTQLRQSINGEDWSVVSEKLRADRDRASCLRWMLRGLPLDKAIRKVRTDMEISGRAADAARQVPDKMLFEAAKWEARGDIEHAEFLRRGGDR